VARSPLRHWPVDPERLRPHIPEGLTLDCHTDAAWVSLTPFRLEGLRPRGLLALPWVSAFPELNFRTHVTRARKPGVFFFSLDAARTVAVMGARAAFHLPYFLAAMQVATACDGTIDYRSHRTGSERPAEFQALYRPVPQMSPLPAEPGTIDHWLTERYWPVRGRPRGTTLSNGDPPRAVGAPARRGEDPLEHGLHRRRDRAAATAHADGLCRRLDVVVWWPRRLGVGSTGAPSGADREARPAVPASR
jgi:hypothetical protein